MTKKIYYVKQGRRYVPVSEYDTELLDSFTQGAHLVITYPGGQTRHYNIDPAYAPMIAAKRVAIDAMCQAMHKASELRPEKKLLTKAQRSAWDKLAQELGDDRAVLTVPSARDVAEAGMNALQIEADTLLLNPAVRLAYEHFLLVSKLTKESQ